MKKQIEYLIKMTDDFGIIQFANNSSPDISTGYTLDDASRALIVSVNLEKNYPNLDKLTEIYINFIKNAQNKDGSFVNVFGASKKPLEKNGSSDSFGRTLWALGEFFKIKGEQEEIISKSLKYLEKNPLEDHIPESFALLGLLKLYESDFEKEKIIGLIKNTSASLKEKIKKHSDKHWFGLLMK